LVRGNRKPNSPCWCIVSLVSALRTRAGEGTCERHPGLVGATRPRAIRIGVRRTRDHADVRRSHGGRPRSARPSDRAAAASDGGDPGPDGRWRSAVGRGWHFARTRAFRPRRRTAADHRHVLRPCRFHRVGGAPRPGGTARTDGRVPRSEWRRSWRATRATSPSIWRRTHGLLRLAPRA
jgi:hypothetical protein